MIPIEKEQIRKQLEDANYQIEKFFHMIEQLKKSLLEVHKMRGIFQENSPEITAKIQPAEKKNITKEEQEKFVPKIEKLNKMIYPHISELERKRTAEKSTMKKNCYIYSKLLKLGYTDSSIEQAVYNATRDNFWSKQFRTLSKLIRKNKDDIYYIDVFLAINRKSTKVNIPTIIR